MSVIAAIESGIVMPNSRQVTFQRRQLKSRSSFSPAPINAMMTTNSVSRSATSGRMVGKGLKVMGGIRNIAAPAAMQMMGSDSGSRLKASGNHATRVISMPAPVSHRI